MRIAVVSAHFPPNFTSGGSLAPHRLAHAIAARGHEVAVYAGHLDRQRVAGEAWDDVSEGGLAVRWIEIHPWIGWSDANNYDNPLVTADYRKWLVDFRPDVVHVHSCQAIGVGVIDAAIEAGIPVVVTMHDFWWCCARQFLVDRRYQPCSLVVDCGTCACEVDHRWLGLRNERLRASLGGVSLVLCPSKSAAAVMAANGVDPARLAVDENGLPESPRPPTTEHGYRVDVSEGRGPVVFRYTGGWNEMKGARVILDAAQALMGEMPSGWRLVAHDIDDFLVANRASIDGSVIASAPAFAPGDAEAIWDATDVLVVPSVMRESHSLVTREALSAGVPVICTDTLGPEEVVRDGVNGLVVPAADVDGLTAAMGYLVRHPDALARMRTECAAVPVASLSDQADGLIARFETLTATAEGSVAPTRVAVAPTRVAARSVGRVLFLVGIDGAPLRYRAHLPAEALHLLGVHSDVVYYRDPAATGLAARADAIVAYRVPATTQILDLIDAARARGVPVLFDVDDLIFDPDLAPEIPALTILAPDEAALWLDGVRRYRTTMEACDAFIGSTAGLCAHATEVTKLPSYPFANGVGLLLGQRSDEALHRPRRPGPLRVGYLSGTDTHDHDWAMVEPAVAETLDAHPGVELWLVGLVAPGPALDRFGERVRRIGFTEWTALPRLLRDIDVNLAPLTSGSRFNEAKSAIKWLEAALVETPTIASATEPFRASITDGVNGLLAETPAGFAAALDRLLSDPALRRRLATRARRDALLRWSPHLQGRAYLDILESSQRRTRPSAWTTPVAPDEPFQPHPLEAYELPRRWSMALPPPVRLQYRRLRSFLWRSARTVQHYGPLGVLRRVPGRLRRRP